MKALISVSDKTGIVDFSKQLEDLNIEIISTGGTYNLLKENGIKVTNISDVTGYPECLDGRVKTLHPNIHAGILAIRDNKEHMEQIEKLNISLIDIVVVNLYPFKQTILKENVSLEEAIENIDIGGPSMLRAAAKNYQDVSVITSNEDYNKVLEELKTNGKVSKETNFYLSAKVFSHTAHYDTLIANYMKEKANLPKYDDTITMTFEKVQDMRYGENPHQMACFYKEIGHNKGMLTNFKQLHGKEMSFNNVNDTNGALDLLKEFDEPTIVACKHSNPCGVASASSIYDAYVKAYNADPTSIFGGIVVSNREIDEKTALEMNKIFLEVILAPSFTKEALDVLTKKANIRLLTLDNIDKKQPVTAFDIKKVSGGILVQDINNALLSQDELKVVTKRKPTDKEMEDLIFTWKIVKYAKSNGIALGKNKQSIGIGNGQVNRIWATRQAIEHGQEMIDKDVIKDSVLASDAFFPFDDCVREAIKNGVTAIIQPGGSIRDEDSIKLCDEHNIAMVFTNIRHFKH
ncbi:bifunctional phosphoribosylaminoimidazolecarboxamide formyltransferase/IMP cyclohydrolase [uncultured Tyzzerella sp.]|uniref:bifunctional phosphoribosylaminoimidazolecarboxamide formyltransferase/IMP cyclohydrolase n=1 Tax=uncultured Tyzzerella sp. TaxID=2321398 RepID=UPI0029437C0F|nr:bifunctional phosphoribosylaminoimidazolecarboxamide formyltransferase/IMP cyclohydrolase [uncultured Tyzzerella sp.]